MIIWHQDETNTIEYLANLLMADLHIKLEPFEGGRSAPKPKGATAKRIDALALQQRKSEQTADVVRELKVAYTEGALSLVQVWDVRGPQRVSQDWRHGEHFMMKTSLPVSKTNSLEKVLFNLVLPRAFAEACVKWRLAGQSSNSRTRKTTLGEVVRSWGYYGAIATHPGEPVEGMWRQQAQPGNILPPPGIGRHGLSRNRFVKLRELQGMMFPKD